MKTLTWLLRPGSLRTRVSLRSLGTPPHSRPSLLPAVLLGIAFLGALMPLLPAAAGDVPLSNTLAVGSGSGGTGNDVTVDLSLANGDAVKGLQTEITFDPQVVEFVSAAKTARVGTMSLSASVSGGNKLIVVMYYGDASTLAPGTGAVAQLTFHLAGAGGTSSNLTPANTVLSDADANPLQVNSTAGLITVTGGGGGLNLLTVGSGTGGSGTDLAIDLSLDNEDAVKGLQTEIVFDPAVVSFVSAAKTARVGSMTLSTSVSGGNKLIVVMYYSDAANLAPGSGAVAEITFHLAGAGGTFTNLLPTATTLSDPDGAELPVSAAGGQITITGGGGNNLLSVGDASGNSGALVVVSLDMNNQDAVKGVQCDISFDPAVVAFVSGEATSRVGTMTFGASVVDGNKLRVVMYYTDANILAAGTGPIADLTFELLGAGGTQSALTPSGTILSDANGQELAVTAEAGQITVTGGGGGGQNILSVGTGNADSGTQVGVPLALDNEDEVKGLQTDIAFDPAVVQFVSGQAAARAETMTFAASVIGGNKVRVVMYYSDAGTLDPGTGSIADLSFLLVGDDGSQTALTPQDSQLSDPQGSGLDVTEEAGSIEVTGPPAGLNLSLSVLKNPGRTRILQVFVSADRDLDGAPDVTAGSQQITMETVQGTQIYQGKVFLAAGVSSVTVTATGIAGGTQRTVNTTVTF